MRLFEYASPGFPSSLVDFTRERYRLKEIHIPMSRRGVQCEWSYREWVLIPEWMSDESAGAALKAIGYLFEERHR
jgi:hypothetical protein